MQTEEADSVGWFGGWVLGFAITLQKTNITTLMNEKMANFEINT